MVAFLAGDFLAACEVAFLAGDFLVAVFFAAVFLAGDFFADCVVVFLPVAFLAVDFAVSVVATVVCLPLGDGVTLRRSVLPCPTFVSRASV